MLTELQVLFGISMLTFLLIVIQGIQVPFNFGWSPCFRTTTWRDASSFGLLKEVGSDWSLDIGFGVFPCH